MNWNIPLVGLHRNGRERLLGQASTEEAAERLAERLRGLYIARPITVYIDYSRTPDEVREQHA